MTLILRRSFFNSNQFIITCIVSKFRYLLVLNGSFFGWLAFGSPLLPNSMINYYHKYVAYLGVMACHYSFYVACKEGPGAVTVENTECFKHHQYDGVLYIEGLGCRTCLTTKVRTFHRATLYFLAYRVACHLRCPHLSITIAYHIWTPCQLQCFQRITYS